MAAVGEAAAWVTVVGPVLAVEEEPSATTRVDMVEPNEERALMLDPAVEPEAKNGVPVEIGVVKSDTNEARLLEPNRQAQSELLHDQNLRRPRQRRRKRINVKEAMVLQRHYSEATPQIVLLQKDKNRAAHCSEATHLIPLDQSGNNQCHR